MQWLHPRSLTPPSLIRADTVDRLSSLPRRAWDVVTAAEFLDALGVDDPMLANRWLYRRSTGTPPFEPVGRWRVGPGAPRVIRKDRAIVWAETGGASPPARECWPIAAGDLAELGWPGLSSAEEVQQILSLLLHHGIVEFATPPKLVIDIDNLYA